MAAGKNGGEPKEKPRSVGEGLALLFEGLAELEATQLKIVQGQGEIKTMVDTVSPRLDGLNGSMQALSKDVLLLAKRLHRTNNIVQLLVDVSGALHQAEAMMGRALDALEARVRELRPAAPGGSVGDALESVDARIDLLRRGLSDENELEREGDELDEGE